MQGTVHSPLKNLERLLMSSILLHQDLKKMSTLRTGENIYSSCRNDHISFKYNEGGHVEDFNVKRLILFLNV